MGAIAVESAGRRRLPPVTEVGAASMIVIAAGVIYVAAHLPKHAPLGIAVALLVVAAALQVLNAALLARIPTSPGIASSRSHDGLCSRTR